MESVDNILQASTWHNVVLTYENESIKLYVDGQVVASNLTDTVDLSPTGLLENFVVGSNMTGSVDEIQFYNKVLTTEEVGHIAYEGNYSATLANYDLKFNELTVTPTQVIDSKTGARYTTTNATYEDGFVDGSKSIRFTNGGDVSLGDVDLSQKNAVSISTWVNLDTLTNTGQTIVKKDGVIDMSIDNKDIKLTLGSTPISFTPINPTAPMLNDEKFSFSDPTTAFDGSRVESYESGASSTNYVYEFKVKTSPDGNNIDISEIYGLLDSNNQNITLSFTDITVHGSGHYIADGATLSTLVDGTKGRPYVRWTNGTQYTTSDPRIFTLSLSKKLKSIHIAYNGSYGVPVYDIYENGTLMQMTDTVVDTVGSPGDWHSIKYSLTSDQVEQIIPTFYTNQMTISSWVKTSNTSKQNIISVGENVHVGLNNNTIECDVDKLTGLATTTIGVSSFNIENANYSGDIFNSVGNGTDSIDFDVASPNSLQTYKLKRFTFGVPFRSYAPTSLTIIGVNGTTETTLVTYPIAFKNSNHVYDIIIDDTNAAIDNDRIKVKFNGSGAIKVKNVGVESAVEDSITASITSNENSVTISGNVSRPGTLKVHSVSSSETANVYTFKFNSGADNIRPMPYMMILFDQNNQVIDPVDKIFKFGPDTNASDAYKTNYTNIDPGHQYMSWGSPGDWQGPLITNSSGDYVSGKVLFTIELKQGTLLKDVVLFVHGNGGGQPTLDAYLNDTLITTTSTFVGGYVETTHNGSRDANPLADGHFDARTFTYDGYDNSSAPLYAGKSVWSLAAHDHPTVSDYRTTNNLVASTTINADTSFDVTFEDIRSSGVYSYYISVEDGSNVMNFEGLNLSAQIVQPQYLYDINYIQGSSYVKLDNSPYTFYALGATGAPGGNTNYNNKGAYVSFDINGNSTDNYISVVGGVSTSIDYGAAGSGGSPYGAANGGFTGGGFSGLFITSITPGNAIGVAGGSGAASAGENMNYAKKGGPGRGQVVTTSSSMQGGTGQNAYYNGSESSKAGGGGGGGGFTGGAGGNMGNGDYGADGGEGGTSYVISTATNVVIEGAPTDANYPTAWTTLKANLGVNDPPGGAMVVKYSSSTQRTNNVNKSYITFSVTFNYQSPTWYVYLHDNTVDDVYTIYYRSQNISINGSGGLYNTFINTINTIDAFTALGGVTTISNVTSNWAQTIGVPWAHWNSDYNLSTNLNQTQFIVVNNSKKTMYKYALTHYTASTDNDARAQAGRSTGVINPQKLVIDYVNL